MKQTVRKIHKILKDEEYEIDKYVVGDVLSVVPNGERYNEIRNKLEKGLSCKVSRLKLDWKKHNVIKIFYKEQNDKNT